MGFLHDLLIMCLEINLHFIIRKCKSRTLKTWFVVESSKRYSYSNRLEKGFLVKHLLDFDQSSNHLLIWNSCRKWRETCHRNYIRWHPIIIYCHLVWSIESGVPHLTHTRLLVQIILLDTESNYRHSFCVCVLY